MTTPRLTTFAARSQQTFSALMWALSYPGRVYQLAERDLAAFALIGAALLDLETSYWAGHPELANSLAPLGARLLAPHLAHYQLYPELSVDALDALATAPVGTHLDPDASATLVLGCAIGSGRRLLLSGPGIAAPLTLSIGGLPASFWELRAQACRFPLGWDIFFVDGDRLLGLPRSTKVEVL